MKRCTKCVIPDTRPNIVFDENGVCSSCNYLPSRNSWDFEKLKNECLEFVKKHKKNPHYDCAIAVSGGKDSYYSVKTLKEWGLNPLCISIRPLIPSPIGIKNLHNMVYTFGVDLIQITLGEQRWRDESRKWFLEHGNCFEAWVIATIRGVQDMAKKFDIPIVFYGENGNAFYGGSTEKTVLEEYSKYLTSGQEVIALNLSDWAPFVSSENLRIAKEYGFTENSVRSVGGFTKGYSIDDTIDELYLWFTYPKFGYGTATKYGAQLVREGKMTREEALDKIDKYDGEFPFDNIDLIMKYLGITIDEIIATIRKFTNYHHERIEGFIQELEKKKK